MTKKPIKLEFISVKPEIVEEYVDEKTQERSMKVRMKFQHADLVNRNGRKYRKELLQREIDRLKEPMAEGAVFGASYHPKGADAEVNDVSHIWHKVWMEKDGSCVGEATILPTRNGKDAMTIIKHGGRIGISSRGLGTVTKKTDEVDGNKVTYDDVNDDYKMLSPGDMVLTPSVPDASIRSIIEKHIEENYFSKEDDQMDKKPSGDNKKNEVKMNIDEIKKLKEENPDAFKEYEAELQDEFLKSEVFTKTVDDAVEAKKEEWKEELSGTVQEALDEIDTKLKDIKKALDEGRLDTVKEILDSMIESDEEEQEENADADDKDESTELEDLRKSNTELKQKLADLEAKQAEEQKAKEDAEKEEQKQAELKAKVEEVLGKEKYKPYKTLIEDEIFENEKVVGIENLEKVEEVIEAKRAKLSEMKTKLEKVKITESNLEPKGKVENQDNESPEELAKKAEKTLREKWLSDRQAGCKLSLDEYKEKFGNKK